MTTSTNGVISFGVVCEEDTEFPWEKYCIDEWWREINGFQEPLQPFAPEGEYAEGWSEGDPRFGEMWEHQIKWDKEHPIPVELENYCSGDCPMYAIVVPGLGYQAVRGYPKSFDPSCLRVTAKQQSDLLAFLIFNDIPYEGEPGWLLTSYWG